MHGLINRSIESFLRDSYGDETWAGIAGVTGVIRFEALMPYEDSLTDRLLDRAVTVLEKDRGTLLEDMGTYLAAHPKQERLRRLLRFGGADFVDFLLSLDDLSDRARLAIADLHLPQIEVLQDTPANYRLFFRPMFVGAGHVLAGLIRAMADDYGALVVVEHEGQDGSSEVLGVQLLDAAFAEGREFALSVALP